MLCFCFSPDQSQFHGPTCCANSKSKKLISSFLALRLHEPLLVSFVANWSHQIWHAQKLGEKGIATRSLPTKLAKCHSVAWHPALPNHKGGEGSCGLPETSSSPWSSKKVSWENHPWYPEKVFGIGRDICICFASKLWQSRSPLLVRFLESWRSPSDWELTAATPKSATTSRAVLMTAAQEALANAKASITQVYGYEWYLMLSMWWPKGFYICGLFHIEQIYTNCVLDHILYKQGRYDTYDIWCKHHNLNIPCPVSSTFFHQKFPTVSLWNISLWPGYGFDSRRKRRRSSKTSVHNICKVAAAVSSHRFMDSITSSPDVFAPGPTLTGNVLYIQQNNRGYSCWWSSKKKIVTVLKCPKMIKTKCFLCAV